MKLTNKFKAFLFGFAGLLASGCEKEVSNLEITPVPVQKKAGCWLTQDSVENSDGADRYQYDDAGNLILIDRRQYKYTAGPDYETLEYNGNGSINRHNLFREDSTLYQYNTYQYNSIGHVATINTFVRQLDSLFEASEYETYVYDAQGRPVKIVKFLNPQATGPHTTVFYDYSGDSSMVERWYNGQPSGLFSVTEYRFDNKKNPFAGLVFYNRWLLWKHNFISMKPTFQSGGGALDERIIAYQYNSQGYPIKATHNYRQRQSDVYFTYQCQ